MSIFHHTLVRLRFSWSVDEFLSLLLKVGLLASGLGEQKVTFSGLELGIYQNQFLPWFTAIVNFALNVKRLLVVIVWISVNTGLFA